MPVTSWSVWILAWIWMRRADPEFVRKAGIIDIIGRGGCYRPYNQGIQEDDALCIGHIGAVLDSEAWVLKGNFNHPDICCWDNTEEHKQFRRFLDCIYFNILLQVIEEPMRRSVVFNYSHATWNVKGSLGDSDHEMEFKTLSIVNKVYSELTTWPSGEQTLASLGEIPPAWKRRNIAF